MADDRNRLAGLAAFRGSKTRYLIAAALGLQPAAIFFIAFAVLGAPSDGVMAYMVVLFTLLIWLVSTLLIVYTRIPLTYTKKTFDLLTNSGELAALFMIPFFALGTFPVDILDAVIERRRRRRAARIRSGPGPSARD